MLHKKQTVGHMRGTRQIMIVLLFELFVRMAEFFLGGGGYCMKGELLVIFEALDRPLWSYDLNFL